MLSIDTGGHDAAVSGSRRGRSPTTARRQPTIECGSGVTCEHWRLLPPEQSALMHEALQTVGATSEVEWIEGADHVFFGVDPDPIADRSADFLVRHFA